MNHEDIVRKVRALMAKAKGTENEHEAVMFAEKAAELMQRYNLDHAAVTAGDEESHVDEGVFVDLNLNHWRKMIWSSVARLYFYKIYNSWRMEGGKLRPAVVVVGRPHNRVIVQSMAEYLIRTTLRLAKEFSSYRKEVLQFEKGCGLRISQRVYAMVPKHEGLVIEDGKTPTTLPALYKTELQLVQDFMDKLGLSKGRAYRMDTNSNAFAHGRAAGDRVHLGGQIGGAAAGRMIGGR